MLVAALTLLRVAPLLKVGQVPVNAKPARNQIRIDVAVDALNARLKHGAFRILISGAPIFVPCLSYIRLSSF